MTPLKKSSSAEEDSYSKQPPTQNSNSEDSRGWIGNISERTRSFESEIPGGHFVEHIVGTRVVHRISVRNGRGKHMGNKEMVEKLRINQLGFENQRAERKNKKQSDSYGGLNEEGENDEKLAELQRWNVLMEERK